MDNFSKFSTFSKFVSFYEEPIYCDVIIIDEIVFSQKSFLFSQTFNKKCNSYINFFLVLCFTPFVADLTFITLLLSDLRLREFLPIV